MKIRTLVLLVLFALTVPALSHAQAIKAGTWTGTIAPPDDDEEGITFDVTVKGDSLGIVIHAGEHGDFTAEGGYYTDGKITFTFTPGIRVACSLVRNDTGAFAGDCVGDDGEVGQMTMVPPKDG